MVKLHFLPSHLIDHCTCIPFILSSPYRFTIYQPLYFTGYERFYKRTSLETSDILKDDCLIMRCTVAVVRNSIEASRHSTISIPPSDMGQRLKELLKSGKWLNLIMQTRAHICICTHIYNHAHVLFFSFNCTHRFAYVHPDNFSEHATIYICFCLFWVMRCSLFHAMLLFIYSDALPDVHELTESDSIYTYTIMVQHLIYSRS